MGREVRDGEDPERDGRRRQGGGGRRGLVGRRACCATATSRATGPRSCAAPARSWRAWRASRRAAARCAGSPRRTARTFDPRRTLREAMRTGGVPIERAWREPKLVPRKLVYLVDVSGSMEPYARAMVMFLQAAVRAGRHVEAFTFGTRLTRLTPHLAGRDPDRALANAARAVPDWAGGTRIGENLKAFNDVWGRRGLTRGAIVVIASDGWERGDPTLLAEQMRRLHLAAHRIVWTNPLAGGEGYRPLVAGMQAALPYVDDFLPGHNLRALETLAEVLEEIDEGPRSPRARYAAVYGMNDDTLRTADLWRTRGDEVALATVVRTRRSAPRPLGSKFAVGSRGEMAGSVSGGCVEGAVVGEAQSVLEGGPPKLRVLRHRQRRGLGRRARLRRRDLGLDRALRGLGDAGRARRPRHRDQRRPRRHARLRDRRRRQRRGARGARRRDRRRGRGGDLGRAQPDRAARRRRPDLRRGARAVAAARRRRRGRHGGRALPHGGRARLAYRRDRSARRVRDRRAHPVGRTRSSSSGPRQGYDEIELRPEDHIAVLTHDPKLDDPAISGALRRGVGYVGALGSRRTQEKRRDRLRESGISDEQLERISGPIGLDLGAHTPEETADLDPGRDHRGARGPRGRPSARREGPHPRGRRGRRGRRAPSAPERSSGCVATSRCRWRLPLRSIT